jgi:hypothetical protein
MEAEAGGVNRGNIFVIREGLNMWLAKIFGGTKTRIEDLEGEEPARFPVDHEAENTSTRESRRRAAAAAPAKPPVAAQTKPGGFDPYNSGTFKKENAWERVTRK